jgi:hypothetical protein
VAKVTVSSQKIQKSEATGNFVNRQLTIIAWLGFFFGFFFYLLQFFLLIRSVEKVSSEEKFLSAGRRT